ncbi:MAG: ribonuclease H-like domain-containing protein [Oscillospiraceae bacterium]|nr:ribonuclease H-like domain-containing protein [Oscillospiraceae bacterium]
MVTVTRYTGPLIDLHDYIVFDTETTGVNPYRDKIIQFAVALVEGDKITKTAVSFVNPGCHVPEEASRVNHIYDADLVGAPTYADIAPSLAKLLFGRVVVAHNAVFDMTLAKELLDRCGTSGKIEYVDTLIYARRVFKNMPDYKLQTLANKLGIDAGYAHRADSDIITCHHLFQLCKAHTQDPGLSQTPSQPLKSGIWPNIKDFAPTLPIPDDSAIVGTRVCFTGDFPVPLATVYQTAVNAGAVLQDKITYKTNVLVVGTPRADYSDASGKSRKMLRVEELNAEGKTSIETITFAEFLTRCGSAALGAVGAKNVDQAKDQPASDASPRKNISTIPPIFLWALVAVFGLGAVAMSFAAGRFACAIAAIVCIVLASPKRKKQ